MSSVKIKPIVDQFICDGHNDLLVIKGGWGAGKTYFWQDRLNNAKKINNAGKEYYAYVSLFGVNSLDELKNSIIAAKADTTTNNSDDWFNRIRNITRKASVNTESIPILRNYTEGIANQLAFNFLLKDMLICFDDIERRGDGLGVKELMGLASLLKEQRNCQIVFIMNEDSLDGHEAEEFRRHSEKIIDIELEFSPSSEEAFGYVFLPSYPHYTFIKERCLRLNIKNIRIIQRIRRFIDGLQTYLERSEEAVIEQILRSAILYVWCYYDKDSGAPSLEYVEKFEHVRYVIRNEYIGNAQKEDANPQEKVWASKLAAYGYSRTDQLDLHLMSLIKTGYLDSDAFTSELVKSNDAARTQQGSDALRSVWKLYSESFDNNENEFVEQLVSTFRANIQHLALTDLASAAWVLRELGHEDLENSLIDEYIIYHRDTLAKVHRDHIMVTHQVKSPKIIGRLTAIWDSMIDQRTLADVVQKIAYRDGWNPDDVAVLARAEVDDFYQLFKSEKSEALYLFVRACLRFSKMNDDKGISNKAEQALRMIASESRINRVRISNYYEIKLDDE